MKNRKAYTIIFSVILIAFIVYYFCCMTTYIQMKIVGNQDNTTYFIWCNIDEIILNNDILNSFFITMRNKFPEWTMLTAIIINGANMIFGFINNKKKWWYYLILIITIIMSIMLWDCFQILIHQE